MRFSLGLSLVAALALVTIGCDTAPKTSEGKHALVQDSQAALSTLISKDASLQGVVDNAAGYAIFPDVGKGGVGIGGAYGRGVVYENGLPVGFAELNQASIGFQLGGQTYIELLVFQDEDAVSRFKAGNFDLGADASAVALTAGAGAAARFEKGVAIFTMPKGGAMFEASVNGQKFNYEPMTDQMRDDVRNIGDNRDDNR